MLFQDLRGQLLRRSDHDADAERKREKDSMMKLEQALVELFRTEGIDFGDGDVCSIIEAVEEEFGEETVGALAADQEATHDAGWEDLEKRIKAVMPAVVVALIRERNRVGQYSDEILLALAKVFVDGYPPPYIAIRVIEAALPIFKEDGRYHEESVMPVQRVRSDDDYDPLDWMISK